MRDNANSRKVIAGIFPSAKFFLDTEMRDFFARVILRIQETSLSCFVLTGATSSTWNQKMFCFHIMLQTSNLLWALQLTECFTDVLLNLCENLLLSLLTLYKETTLIVF